MLAAKPHFTESRKFVSAHRSFWALGGFQFVVGLLISVAVPWLVRVSLFPSQINSFGLTASLAGTLIAFLSGFMVFRRLSRYPGVATLRYILPIFLISYGILLSVFFVFRIDYSRAQFIVSFLLCVAWFLLVQFKLRRLAPMQIGVVPYGQIERMMAIPGVEWILLSSPDHARGLNAIAADLRAEIPAAWERCLADQAIRGNLVLHVKQLEESLTGCVTIEHLSENNLGSLIPGLIYGKVKRVVDFGSAIFMIFLLAPLFVLIALLLKLESPGPVFFIQQRMGYRGVPFRIYKFRSMRLADDVSDPRAAAMTASHDCRVTRVGRILRRYRLDELPQVLNIIKGEMSWIGPRPEALPLSLWYEEELPFYRYRHIVRPGISGWAQVNQGHVSEVHEVLGKLSYDFFYIKNFSLWLDILVIVKTARTVLVGFGVK